MGGLRVSFQSLFILVPSEAQCLYIIYGRSSHCRFFHNCFIQRKGDERHKPDSDWVQCYSCRKWRMLNAGFNVDNLPEEWFVSGSHEGFSYMMKS